MWLYSNNESDTGRSLPSCIQLPRNLSEFQPNLWLSDQKPMEEVEEDIFDKWLLVDPLNKPCQTTTTAIPSNEVNSVQMSLDLMVLPIQPLPPPSAVVLKFLSPGLQTFTS
ncbi:unnamed protein product [Lepeophtheirus salmonis]|uniref:(salmon louse) hypothetical protein n=1 Tax=Lepeophtheirus salmonis TaxID=72036 RepID=A0A7R8CDJ6_LEPSM|nr:unnamed protein product [Lepeophtheirus salmonis]CAF2781621.1 unnamed protein product [Lepeophtheirus salmonis]